MSGIRRWPEAAIAFGVVATLALATAPGIAQQPPAEWPIHSTTRPQPRTVDPGPFMASVPAPSDAIVLLDSRMTALTHWRSADSAGARAPWKLQNGTMEIVTGSGGIVTTGQFGDVQLHVEWMAPNPPTGEGQDRGNSGVFFMGRYEVQILDSYKNVTYPDGQAASLYGQHPPLVNASRPPGHWQTYDILFHRPRFDDNGVLLAPARVTVFHNGVLAQNDAVMTGATRHQQKATYSAHANELPIMLQEHGAPVRFRNIWVRKL
jgi:hypothetical protein